MARRRQSPKRRAHEAMLGLAYRLVCPKCDAQPGYMCANEQGRTMWINFNGVRQVHAARRKAIEEKGWRIPEVRSRWKSL